MKILKMFSIAIALLLLMSQAASAQAPERRKLQNLTVTAFVDGRDFFYLTPRKAHWHHLDYCVVGRYVGDWPTGLLMDRQAPNTQYLSWIPSWPCSDRCCSGERVNCSPFALTLPLPPQYQLESIEELQAPDGGSVKVHQYPSPDNGYTTIIDFDDDPLGGPHWYQVLLTFAAV